MKSESTIKRSDGGRVKIVTKLNTGTMTNKFKYVQNVFTSAAGSNEWVPVIDHTSREYRSKIGNDKRLAYIKECLAQVVTTGELHRACMKLHDMVKPEPPADDTKPLDGVNVFMSGVGHAYRTKQMKRFMGSGLRFQRTPDDDTTLVVADEGISGKWVITTIQFDAMSFDELELLK